MKVLILNDSPRVEGNVPMAIAEQVKTFSTDGVESNVVNVGLQSISGCRACYACGKVKG